MSDDYKNATVLVICNPLFVSLAERLARDFGVTYLYVPISGSFPTLNLGQVGYGLEGVERVDSIFGEHFEEIDLFCFFDLYHADEQTYLESLGKRVFGARNGEELEIYRELCKKAMEQEGLPVGPWKLITGMDSLREHLKAHENQHVKIDRWRGLTETFCAETYELVEPKLDEIERDLGGFKDMIEFIVEDDLPDRVEIGIDAYCIDGEFPSSALVGIEVKDLAYCAEFKKWDDIPEPLRRWNETMAGLLTQYAYRGFLSTEVRIGQDKVPYMVDACCRCGSPPSELYSEFFENFCEIIWEGAGGVMVNPKPKARFGVQAVLKSKWADGHWQAVSWDDEYKDNVKLFNCVVIEGRRYVVPLDETMTEIGAVIGWGDSIEEAIEMVRKVGETIKGYGIKFTLGPVEEAQKQMEEINNMGLDVFELEATAKAE